MPFVIQDTTTGYRYTGRRVVAFVTPNHPSVRTYNRGAHAHSIAEAMNAQEATAFDRGDVTTRRTFQVVAV
jgi:hypothetical protein